jgi:hypothetical protein
MVGRPVEVGSSPVTEPGKIIPFKRRRPVPVAASIGSRFEGYPRFAKAFEAAVAQRWLAPFSPRETLHVAISQGSCSQRQMATVYTVQSFQIKGLKLVADQPKSAKTSAAAIELAELFKDTKAGVVVFSQEVDIGTDCHGEPQLLFRSGTLPKGLFD